MDLMKRLKRKNIAFQPSKSHKSKMLRKKFFGLSRYGNWDCLSQQEENPQEQTPPQNIDPNTDQPIPPEPTAEEMFSYELEGAEDKVIQVILYNRLMELATKLELLQINVQDGVGVKSKYYYDKITQYKQYVDVLNELIFSISTSTIYKLVGQIELELIDLLNEYSLSYNDNLIYDEAREAVK